MSAKARPKPWIILITDRRRVGGAIRAVARPHLGQKTTHSVARASRFATKREARAFLRGLGRDPRSLYTICEV